MRAARCAGVSVWWVCGLVVVGAGVGVSVVVWFVESGCWSQRECVCLCVCLGVSFVFHCVLVGAGVGCWWRVVRGGLSCCYVVCALAAAVVVMWVACVSGMRGCGVVHVWVEAG